MDLWDLEVLVSMKRELRLAGSQFRGSEERANLRTAERRWSNWNHGDTVYITSPAQLEDRPTTRRFYCIDQYISLLFELALIRFYVAYNMALHAFLK